MSEKSEITLPPLSDDSIARIESAVFDEIVDERPVAAKAAPRRRRRTALTALGIAAAFVGGVLVAPPLLSAVTGQSQMASDADGGGSVELVPAAGDTLADTGDVATESSAGGDAGAQSARSSAVENREIITTAQMSLRVGDVEQAADRIAGLAEANGGFVESTDLGLAVDEARTDTSPSEPHQPGSGWISIRVPADDLQTVMDAVGEDGEVVRSSISRQDVTSVAVDLRARVDAAEASVKRLTELMEKSGSVGDLIAAESALSERQAMLEAYRQELKMLDEQVAMSTISVELSERTTATTADPAGFSDGLLAGWNGLIVSMNALVVALGFLLPWLAIAAAVVLVVWLIRRRRRAPDTTE